MSTADTTLIRYDGAKAIVAFCALGLLFAVLGTLSFLIRLTGYEAGGGAMPWWMHPNASIVGLVIGGLCVATGVALFFVFRTKLSVALELTPEGISTRWRVPKASLAWTEISRVERSDGGLRLFDSTGHARIALPTLLLDLGPEALQQLIERYRRAQTSRATQGGQRTGFGRRG